MQKFGCAGGHRVASVFLTVKDKPACPASVYLEDYGCYVGYPAVIGKNGVEYVHRLELTEEEKKLLDKSALMIAQKTKEGLL